MDSFSATWSIAGLFDPDHLMLMATLFGVMALMTINAAATLRVYSAPGGASAKRLWLAAIWAAPGAALAVWALAGVRSKESGNRSRGRS